MKRRILAVLVCIALLLAILPNTAFAVGLSELYVCGTQIPCGADSLWKLAESGGLQATDAENDDWVVKYESDSDTLTLRNATITGVDKGSHRYAGIYAEGNLTISLIGDNTVASYGSANENNACGAIYCIGALTIKGPSDSSLMAQGTSGGSRFGIAADVSLTVTGGNITGKATSQSSVWARNYGVLVDGSITLNCKESTSSLTGMSGTAASSANDSICIGISAQSISLNGSSALKGTAGEAVSSSYGNSYGVHATDSITLENSALLEGTAGTAATISQGVYAASISIKNAAHFKAQTTARAGFTIRASSPISIDGNYTAAWRDAADAQWQSASEYTESDSRTYLEVGPTPLLTGLDSVGNINDQDEPCTRTIDGLEASHANQSTPIFTHQITTADTSVKLMPRLSNSEYTVWVNDVPVPSGAYSDLIEAPVGYSTITIKVAYTLNGPVVASYTVDIFKQLPDGASLIVNGAPMVSVAGTTVTVTPSDDGASYDERTNTLTLNGYNGRPIYANNMGAGFRILCRGTNSITGVNNTSDYTNVKNGAGVFVNGGTLTFECEAGSATTVTGSACGIYDMRAIHSTGLVKLTGEGSLRVICPENTSTGSTVSTTGIYALNGLTVSSGSLYVESGSTANGFSHGILANNGTVTVEGGRLEAVSGVGTAGSNGITGNTVFFGGTLIARSAASSPNTQALRNAPSTAADIYRWRTSANGAYSSNAFVWAGDETYIELTTSAAPKPNPQPSGEVTVYNNESIPSATIWLTGCGLNAGDPLITERAPKGSAYTAIKKLAGENEIFNTYNIYLRSGRKSTGSAMYLTFDLAAKYAGQAFTLVHQKADGAYEYFHATGDANGDLSFGPLYEVSPFMLVFGTLIPAPVTIPQTGDGASFIPGGALALIGIAGFAFAILRRRRGE